MTAERPPGPPVTARSRLWSTALWLYAVLFFIFLYAPLLMLVAFSVNDSELIALPFRGFTLKWYGQVLADQPMISALLNSIMLGVASGLLATALGLGLALSFRRLVRFKSWLLGMIMVPIIVPGIIGGVVLLIFFGHLGVSFGLFTTVLAAHTTWALPFAFLTLYPRLHRLDASLEEAAMDLGARPFTVFRRIVLPIARPGIYATFLFSFTLSFDEFVRTLFVVGPERTVPVHIWTLVVERMAPYLPAASVIIMAISIFASLVAFLISARADARARARWREA